MKQEIQNLFEANQNKSLGDDMLQQTVICQECELSAITNNCLKHCQHMQLKLLFQDITKLTNQCCELNERQIVVPDQINFDLQIIILLRPATIISTESKQGTVPGSDMGCQSPIKASGLFLIINMLYLTGENEKCCE